MPDPALPRDLAFLHAHGVSEEALARADRAARASGVDPVTALLRVGYLGEERFYRALARELGVPFLEAFRLAPGARYPESIQSGIAPILEGDEPGAETGLVLAPAGRDVAALLAVRRRRRLAITTPRRLREALLAARAEAVAEAAAEGLRRNAPHWCYLPGLTLAQVVAIVAGVAALGFLARLVPEALGEALVALAGGIFLAMTTFKLASLLVVAPLAPPPMPRQDDRALPVYTVIVALYREARVVPRIVRALAALDYPAAKLDIKFVLEADDRETRAALEAIPLPGRFEVVVAPPGAPRTKPRALNVALPLARGTLLVVFDAEDVPDPAQLRTAAGQFARLESRVACLQGRLVIDNTRDGWLARLFTLEYAALFDVLGPALAAWEMPYPLGGTSTHFRTAILRRLHGWDAWNVTEDADLGIRLALEGYRVGDLPSATLEEAPARLGAWLRQRTRWMKGYMQVCVTHSRRPTEILSRVGPTKAFGAVTMTLGTVVAALGYPFFMAGALLVFTAPAPLSHRNLFGNALPAIGLVVFGAGLAAMILPPMVGALRRRWWGLALAAFLMPLYFVLVSAAAWRGLVELLRAPSYWHKTEHGLARHSRSGALAQLTGGARARPPRPRAGEPG